MEFQDQLRLLNVKVPIIIRNKGNSLFTKIIYSDNTHFYFLQKFELGSSWSTSKNQIISAAKELAEVHKKSELLFNEKVLISNAPQATIFTLAKKMIIILGNILKSDYKGDDAEYINLTRKFIDYAIKKVNDFEKTALLKGYGELSLYVHGDYNPWNLVFDNDSVIGILDFDNSIIDNPVHDIAEAIVNMSFMKYKSQRMIYQGVPTGFDKSLFMLFLLNYEKYNKNIIRQVKSYLKESILTIIIELFTLGLVRGDYGYRDIQSLIEVIESSDESVDMIISLYKGINRKLEVI